MKIHQNLPITNKEIRKTKTASSGAAFGKILDTELESVQPVAPQSSQEDAPSGQQQSAWRTLEESITLLDDAMRHIESGHPPSAELLHDIEQLRSQLRQQVSSGQSNHDLNQADTLLAVEAERIRAMQSE